MKINWNSTKEDDALISRIVKRAFDMELSSEDETSLSMDLTACHLNGTPLKLNELLSADDFNFSHDVCGISRHINRRTGELENCFLPRFHA